ncbi:MAG: bile acid:sodium symporter, partial [Planctomycetia bacterium]|nr:bile acid:sodium symporter [Planctomycetia bacterium]
PCTLASAAVWTRRAGGNDAVAILVTIITNLACFIMTPLWLLAMTGKSVSSPDLSLAKMSMNLGSLVVLPMTAAQLLRFYKPLGFWATREKRMLSVLAQCGLLAMVMFGAIQSGLGFSNPTQSPLFAFDLIAMLAAVCLVHTVMLWVGVLLARLARFSREDQIAVAFAGSQKTLMVGLLMAISLQVSILPMVAYHVSQLFIDTLIADRFRNTAASGGRESLDGEPTRSA